MCPGFDSRTRRHMWVEFVVGSLLCSERFFSGYSGFPVSLKTNISKFQFDSWMHGLFWTSSCELLGAPWVNKLHSHFFFIFYIVAPDANWATILWILRGHKSLASLAYFRPQSFAFVADSRAQRLWGQEYLQFRLADLFLQGPRSKFSSEGG